MVLMELSTVFIYLIVATELRSCVKVEVVVILDSPSLIILMVYVDVK